MYIFNFSFLFICVFVGWFFEGDLAECFKTKTGRNAAQDNTGNENSDFSVWWRKLGISLSLQIFNLPLTSVHRKCVYVTVLRKNGLIAGLAKIDFFPEKASTKLSYCLSKI